MKTSSLVVTLMLIASPVAAQTTSNLCAMLSDADVSAVIGSAMKVSAAPGQSYKTGGGTVRDQECVYDAPGGLGPTTVRVGITEATSPTLAAQWFKEQAALYDQTMAGKDKGSL